MKTKITIIILLVLTTLGDLITTRIGLNNGLVEVVRMSNFLQEKGLFNLVRLLALIPIIASVLLVGKLNSQVANVVVYSACFLDIAFSSSAILNNIYKLYCI